MDRAKERPRAGETFRSGQQRVHRRIGGAVALGRWPYICSLKFGRNRRAFSMRRRAFGSYKTVESPYQTVGTPSDAGAI